jgi:seryl-tRNA synthetase
LIQLFSFAIAIHHLSFEFHSDQEIHPAAATHFHVQSLIAGLPSQKKDNADHLISQSKALQEKIAVCELEEKKAKEDLDKTLYQIGNFVHESVPVSNDEKNNQIVRTWGDSSARPGALKHYEILPMIEGYDLERGSCPWPSQRFYFSSRAVKCSRKDELFDT